VQSVGEGRGRCWAGPANGSVWQAGWLSLLASWAASGLCKGLASEFKLIGPINLNFTQFGTNNFNQNQIKFE
jgi:hypothetical protein